MTSYRDAGVDQDRKDAAVEEAVAAAETTFREGVIRNPGGFAGLFALGAGRYRDPVLVTSTDGVGTKIKLAQHLGRHERVGIDLVAMSVNDLLVQGADPLFFLDYIAMGRVVKERVKAIIAGVIEGCRIAGCALLGGETAEMPGVYQGEDYDLAGFAVGVAERDRLVTGARIAPGDALLGLRSSGVHSNGYSLVRKIFLEDPARRADLARALPELSGRTLGQALLEPTRIYAGAVRALLERYRPGDEVKGFAHVTGAGIEGNLPRILPSGTGARIVKGDWPVPAVFGIIQKVGGVEEAEMFRVFNMGVGMIVAVPPALAGGALAALAAAGVEADRIGEVVEGSGVELVERGKP